MRKRFCLRFKSKSEEKFLTAQTIEKRNFLTEQQFQDFLRIEQNLSEISVEDCRRLISRFEPSIEGQIFNLLGVDGLRFFLLHDEFCIADTRKSKVVHQNMNRPLTDYFIATSHNTYLLENQIYGESTVEMYIHALRIGCRAVERKFSFFSRVFNGKDESVEGNENSGFISIRVADFSSKIGRRCF